MADQQGTFYDLLGVSRTATTKDIKKVGFSDKMSCLQKEARLPAS